MDSKAESEKPDLFKQLTIIGRGDCGKTSILRRFFKNEFNDDVNATPIESEELDFTVKKLKFKLKIWDTCGQEDFSRFRALTIPMSDYIIICYSIADSLSFYEVKDTLAPMIKDKAKENSKIILVGTKADLRNENTHTYEEGVVLSGNINAFKFIECSSLSNTNIKEIFKVIQDDMYQSVENKPGFFTWLFSCCN